MKVTLKELRDMDLPVDTLMRKGAYDTDNASRGARLSKNTYVDKWLRGLLTRKDVKEALKKEESCK